jgi:DNA-binding response OmpR family regulator
MRVLVIEDDEQLAATVAAGLRHAWIAADVALDGEAGLTRALVNDYDVIVLDRDLPALHGDEVCAKLVAAGGRSRVLMPTGAAENEDLVEGLGLGADGAWRPQTSASTSATLAPALTAGDPRLVER